MLILQRFTSVALSLWQADPAQLGPEQFQSGRSLLWMFVQTIFALGFVCVLAYVILRVVLPRLNVGAAGRSMVRVVERSALDPRRNLYVVEVTGRWLLIGTSEAGVHLVAELNAEKAEQEAESIKAGSAATRAHFILDQARGSARATFSDVLARMVNRR
jgi:flagellar biogenesis protein FliO